MLIAGDTHALHLVPRTLDYLVEHKLPTWLPGLNIGGHLDVKVSFGLKVRSQILAALQDHLGVRPGLLSDGQEAVASPRPEMCAVDP